MGIVSGHLRGRCARHLPLLVLALASTEVGKHSSNPRSGSGTSRHSAKPVCGIIERPLLPVPRPNARPGPGWCGDLWRRTRTGRLDLLSLVLAVTASPAVGRAQPGGTTVMGALPVLPPAVSAYLPPPAGVIDRLSKPITLRKAPISAADKKSERSGLDVGS